MVDESSARRGDSYWMRRALALARTRDGATWPNPAVGAVIVRNGRMIADGYHEGPGRPHAEAAALLALPSPEAAAGATIYVTLEPCHHEGRTPPCTRAIASAGIHRVVYAVGDTNPHVPGDGATWLKAQGIEAEAGPLQREAWELCHRFFESGGGAEPHVTLKLGLSADGRLARRAGPVPDPRERKITGSIAHRRVHALRASSAAVLVGRGTVECDQPRLSARPSGAISRARNHQPRAIVLDSHGRVPPDRYPDGSLVFVSNGLDPSHPQGEIETVPVSRDDHGLSWTEILRELQKRDLGSLLVEGGAAVAKSLLAEVPPQRIHLYLAPKLVGGDGPRFDGHTALEERYTTYRTRRVGDDIEWILRRRDLPPPPASLHP